MVKAVIRNSTAYQKLDYIEERLQMVLEFLRESREEDNIDAIKEECEERANTVEQVLMMLDMHQGLLLYAKKEHGVDLDKILDAWYIGRGFKPEEILK